MSTRGRPSRASIHQRLANEVAELGRYGGLPSPIEAEGIWNEIWFSEAHSSTAIEGNTLVLREVEALLREGRAVGEKQLKDYLEVKGYAEAARWVYSQAIKPDRWDSDCILTLQEICHVHRLAVEPVWQVEQPSEAFDTETPGNWRQHNTQPFQGGMRPPDHTQVQPCIADWVDDVCRLQSEVQIGRTFIAEAVAQRHAQFERIHPFLDGNGRVGRLVMNLILVRLGYPPAIIHKRQRSRYLGCLRKSDQGDSGPLGELTARAIIDNLMRFILPAVAGPVKLVPLEALASGDLSLNAMRGAVIRGRLRAIKSADGRLQSSRQWVESYLASRSGTTNRRAKEST